MNNDLEQHPKFEELRHYLNGIVDGLWKIENDEVEVQGDVRISNASGKRIPVNFSVVHGDFKITDCYKLTSLMGCPRRVTGDFTVSKCWELISMKHGPSDVGGDYNVLFCPKVESGAGISPSAKNYNVVFCVKFPRLEINVLTKNEQKLRDDWLKSGLELSDFQVKRRGTIKAKKFGL